MLRLFPTVLFYSKKNETQRSGPKSQHYKLNPLTSDSQIKVFTYLVHCCYLQLLKEGREEEGGRKLKQSRSRREEKWWEACYEQGALVTALAFDRLSGTAKAYALYPTRWPPN